MPEPPALQYRVAYYAGYDSRAMDEADIPWSIPPAATGLTHLMYFSAMPKVVGGEATIDPAHFSPPLDPSRIAASRSAAGSSATVLLVLGGAQTDVSFRNCLTCRVGTVAVTNGSPNVVGTGTAWTSELVGETFSRTSKGVPYIVQSVTDGTHLTLTTNYAEPTASGVPYEIEWTDRRRRFINQIVEYVAANAVFGGVDTDWEFPRATPQAAARFDTFHRELKAALIAEDPRYVLTSSSGGRYGPAHDAHFIPMIKDLLDEDVLEFFFFQFYAMRQAGFSQGEVGHHENIHHDQSDFGTPIFQAGLVEALQRYLDADLPPQRIVAGCQFGGLVWTGGNMDITDPGRGASGPCMRWTPTIAANRPHMGNEMLYREIVALTGGSLERDVAAGNTPFWSKTVGGGENHQFVSYEDDRSIATKVAFLEGRCGGIGWWHAGSDFISGGATAALKHPVTFALYEAIDDL